MRNTSPTPRPVLSSGAFTFAPMKTLMHDERDKPPKVFKQFVKLLRRAAR